MPKVESRGVHAKPGGLTGRDWLLPVAFVIVFATFVVSSIGFFLGSKDGRPAWSIPLGITFVAILVWIAVWKLRNREPVGPFDLRFLLLGLAFLAGGVGLAATGGDHPTLLARLLGAVFAVVGALAVAAETRDYWLRAQRRREPAQPA